MHTIIWIPVFSLVKLALLFSITALFIIKPLSISFYQQRSGDYFSNKLFDWYNKNDLKNGICSGRRKAMVIANGLNTALWVLSALLITIMLFT